MANHPTLATAGIRACWSNPMTAGAEQNSAVPTPTQQLEPREGQAKFDARRTHSVAISSDKPCAHVTTSRRRFPETEGTSASHVRNERFRAAPGSKHVGRHGTGGKDISDHQWSARRRDHRPVRPNQCGPVPVYRFGLAGNRSVPVEFKFEFKFRSTTGSYRYTGRLDRFTGRFDAG